MNRTQVIAGENRRTQASPEPNSTIEITKITVKEHDMTVGDNIG
jgi:hypothetical protein